MRIRNFDLEFPRADAFFNKLCQKLIETIMVPDLNAEVTISQLTYKDQPIRTLSIPDKGLHVIVVEHGPEEGQQLEVLLVNSYTDQPITFTMLRVLGIPNVRLTQLDVIARMVLDFFMAWSGVANSGELLNELFSAIRDHADIPVNCYRELTYPLRVNTVMSRSKRK